MWRRNDEEDIERNVAVCHVPFFASIGMMRYVLFEKNQKDLFISLAQRNGTKETSTLSKSLPIWRGLTENRRNRRFSDFTKVKSTIKGRFWRFFFGWWQRSGHV